MNTDYTYQIDSAGKAYNSRYRPFTRTPGRSRSRGGQWDYMVRAVCLGCGKTLGHHDLINKFAFCFNCRRVLFPETIQAYESPKRGRAYERPIRHSW